MDVADQVTVEEVRRLHDGLTVHCFTGPFLQARLSAPWALALLPTAPCRGSGSHVLVQDKALRLAPVTFDVEGRPTEIHNCTSFLNAPPG